MKLAQNVDTMRSRWSHRDRSTILRDSVCATRRVDIVYTWWKLLLVILSYKRLDACCLEIARRALALTLQWLSLIQWYYDALLDNVLSQNNTRKPAVTGKYECTDWCFKHVHLQAQFERFPCRIQKEYLDHYYRGPLLTPHHINNTMFNWSSSILIICDSSGVEHRRGREPLNLYRVSHRICPHNSYFLSYFCQYDLKKKSISYSKSMFIWF